MLRNEIGQKNIEICNLQTQVQLANQKAEESQTKFEKLKKEMIGLKKQIDQGKED